jgi:hypothetical protein
MAAATVSAPIDARLIRTSRAKLRRSDALYAAASDGNAASENATPIRLTGTL